MTILRTRASLEGRKALVVGIANEHSIAWGCAKWLRSLGAHLAITYLNENAKKFVVPLAEELESEIFMPMNVSEPGQIEAAVGRAEKQTHNTATSAPQVLKAPWRELGVPHRRLDAAMAKVGLQRTRVGALVRQHESGRMAQHMRMQLEADLGLDTGALDQLSQARDAERCTPL